MNQQRTITAKMIQRYDHIDNFTKENQVLLKGEIACVYTDSKYIKIKIGDGIHHFNDLIYVSDPELVDWLLDNQIELENTIDDNSEELKNRIDILKDRINKLSIFYIITTTATAIMMMIMH